MTSSYLYTYFGRHTKENTLFQFTPTKKETIVYLQKESKEEKKIGDHPFYRASIRCWGYWKCHTH